MAPQLNASNTANVHQGDKKKAMKAEFVIHTKIIICKYMKSSLHKKTRVTLTYRVWLESSPPSFNRTTYEKI